jgi:hypothetical protein
MSANVSESQIRQWLDDPSIFSEPLQQTFNPDNEFQFIVTAFGYQVHVLRDQPNAPIMISGSRIFSEDVLQVIHSGDLVHFLNEVESGLVNAPGIVQYHDGQGNPVSQNDLQAITLRHWIYSNGSTRSELVRTVIDFIERLSYVDKLANRLYDFRTESSTNKPPGRFAVVPVATRSRVYKNESVSVRTYVTGFGHIGQAKLYVSLSAREFLIDAEISDEDLQDDSNSEEDENVSKYDESEVEEALKQRKIPGRITLRSLDTSNIEMVETGENTGYGIVDSETELTSNDNSHPLMTPSTTIPLFRDVLIDNPHESTSFGPPSLMSEANFGEESLSLQGEPPILFEFNIGDADPGDYTLFFTLSYENGQGVQQDKQELTIHVNSWVEENRVPIQRIVIIISLLAFLFTVLGTIFAATGPVFSP